MQIDQSTEEKIIEAAREVFIQKGYAGARMQDIADKGGINKALLHYYFRTKEQLFERIFDTAFQQIIPQLNAVLQREGDVLDKIDAFVVQYIQTIRQHPHIPLFVIHELSQDPERFLKKVTQNPGLPKIAGLMMEILTAMQEGKIKTYPPLHLVMNVLSMCVFPFVAKPIIKTITQMEESYWNEIMDERADMVRQFIRSALELRAD